MRSKLSTSDKFSLIMGLVGIATFLFMWKADQGLTNLLISNESFVDIFSAIFWLAASVICIYRIKNNSQGNNYLLYFWAIFSFLCAGEELKWGYRIFHYSVESLQHINYQHDISLHNLTITTKWFIGPQKLFYLGFFTYFFIVPIFALFDTIKPLKEKLNYVTPGIFFLSATWLTFLLSMLIPFVFTPHTPLHEFYRMADVIAETREMFCAFVVLSYVYLYLSPDIRMIRVDDNLSRIRPSWGGSQKAKEFSLALSGQKHGEDPKKIRVTLSEKG
jgi:hypothetical protein